MKNDTICVNGGCAHCANFYAGGSTPFYADTQTHEAFERRNPQGQYPCKTPDCCTLRPRVPADPYAASSPCIRLISVVGFGGAESPRWGHRSVG